MNMKLRSSARILKGKAVASMRSCVSSFNSLQDDGRATTVLLHGQHAFEMLLKAALNQRQVRLFDVETGRSIGFEAAIRQAQQTAGIKLTNEEAGTLRAIDAMRDDEQHWYNSVDEGILYIHIRAAITLFDDLLGRVFGDTLADHLPLRVLPLSVDPPQDFQILIDREYTKIAEMFQPGRRAGAEARAKIRTLLALEAHNEPDTKVSDADVKRVEKGIRAGKERTHVFPKLSNLGSSISGTGVEVQVRFVKNGGMPVTFINDDTVLDAAAFRSIDLSKRFHWSTKKLADKLGLTLPRAVALRRHLGIDNDPDMTHRFTFEKTSFVRYSDKSLATMKEARDSLDMGQVWAVHRPTAKATLLQRCTQPNCVQTKS